MLIAAFGPPSPMTQWGVHILRATLEILLGPLEVLTSNTIPELRAGWKNRTREHCLTFADTPDHRIVDLLRPSGVGAVAFIEDPRDVVAYAMAERSLGWRAALRLMSLSFSSVHDIYLMPSALVIARHRDLKVADLIETFARHFKLPMSEEQYAEILERLRGGADGTSNPRVETQIITNLPHARPIGAIAEGLSADDLAVVEATCASYDPLLGARPVQRSSWRRELFFDADSPTNPPMSRIDMSGPSRFLFFGPYLHLPRGDWVAELNFAIDQNQSGNSVEFDIFSGQILAKGKSVLPDRGDYRYDLPFSVSDPKQPLEARLAICQGAIAGFFVMKKVIVRKNELVGG